MKHLADRIRVSSYLCGEKYSYREIIQAAANRR
jgi:hypothetical protein